MKKLIYIILDGLGDRPLEGLGNKTPLEAACTPFMDRLAQDGKTGMVYTVAKGIAPESDVAVISMLGYDAGKYYTGRGPLEAYAEGLEVKEGTLAYRVNFATLGENSHIRDRRVGRNLTQEEAGLLCKEVNEKVRLTSYPAILTFKNTIGHRGVLLIRNERAHLSGEVTNTDPAYEKSGAFGVAKHKFENVVLEARPTKGHEEDKSAIESATLTNEFVRCATEVLNASEVNKKRLQEGKLPANVILTRDGGDRLPKFPSINKTYEMRFGCFVEMPVERGIALLTGMHVIDMPLPTADVKSDYALRARMVVEAMDKFDGLYIHLKGPDEPGHDGRYEKKKEVIEAIDSYFFGQLLPYIRPIDVVIAVTSDHSTPCSLKAHSDDPVPLLVTGGGIKSDGRTKFSESECRLGGIGEINGTELMPMLVRFAKEG